jgi:translation elongation factor EF-Ts
VTGEPYRREKDIYASQAAAAGNPPHVVERIVEERMRKFHEETCLNEQPFIKDQTIKVSELIAGISTKLGEKIAVRQFARFQLGHTLLTAVANGDESDGENQAGVAATKPKRPNLGSGFAIADPDQQSE